MLVISSQPAQDLPKKWELSVTENSSLGGISSGPTTLISWPTHSFIQESRWAQTKTAVLDVAKEEVYQCFLPRAQLKQTQL